jgi:hypothetical protein
VTGCKFPAAWPCLSGGRLAGWLAGWLAAWLAGCLAAWMRLAGCRNVLDLPPCMPSPACRLDNLNDSLRKCQERLAGVEAQNGELNKAVNVSRAGEVSLSLRQLGCA